MFHTQASVPSQHDAASQPATGPRVAPGAGAWPSFTLIELLVVMTIITILSSMLMPSFAQALRRVRATVCANNLPRWYMAVESYAEDQNNDYPGLVMWHLNDRFTTYMGRGVDWGEVMMESFGTYLEPEMIKCPARKETRYPGYPKWPMKRAYYYWNPTDYVIQFGRATRQPADRNNNGYGWTRSYWAAAAAKGFGPVANRNLSLHSNTPLMFDRTWTEQNPSHYTNAPQYNSTSNHNTGDRWAEGANILLLDGSHNFWFVNGETWIPYSRDAYCIYYMPREIFVQ